MFFCDDQKLVDLRKLLKVAESCHNSHHCKTAIKYLMLYIKKHKVNSGAYRAICYKVLEYLMDTRDHAKEGFHKPSWNQWQTVTTFPNLKKYLEFN